MSLPNTPSLIEIQRSIENKFLEWLKHRWGHLFKNHSDLCNLWFVLALQSQVEPHLQNFELEIEDTTHHKKMIIDIIIAIIEYIFEILNNWHSKNDTSFAKFHKWLCDTPNQAQLTNDDIDLFKQIATTNMNNKRSYNRNRKSKHKKSRNNYIQSNNRSRNRSHRGNNSNSNDSDDDYDNDSEDSNTNEEVLLEQEQEQNLQFNTEINNFPTYQFVYLGTKHLIVKLQAGVCYLYQWYLNNKIEIVNSMLSYLVIHEFSNQFQLYESEICELIDDYEHVLTISTCTINDIQNELNHINDHSNINNSMSGTEESKNMNTSTTTNDIIYSFLARHQQNHNNNQQQSQQQRNGRRGGGRHGNAGIGGDDDEKMTVQSLYTKLQKQVKDIFPENAFLKDLDPKIIQTFTRNQDNNNIYPINYNKEIDFVSIIDPKHREYECGSYKNLSKEELELELIFPGTLSNTTFKEEDEKLINHMFNIKNTELNELTQTDKKAINSMFLVHNKNTRGNNNVHNNLNPNPKSKNYKRKQNQ